MKKITLITILLVAVLSLAGNSRASGSSYYQEMSKLTNSIRLGDVNPQELSRNQRQLIYSVRNNQEITLTLGQDYLQNEWHDSTKIEYFYNENGLLYFVKSYFIYDDEWEYVMFYEFFYNENNQFSKIFIGSPLSEDELYYIFKLEFNYDNNENLIYIDNFFYDYFDEIWLHENREKHIYDNGNIVEILELMYVDGEFINDYLTVFIYQNNLIIHEIFKFWDYDEWENDMMITYEYNANNDVSYSLEQYWDFFNEIWLDWFKYFFYYDNGNLTEIITQIEYSDNWENYEKQIFEYSVSGRLLVETLFYWFGGLWEPELRWLNTWETVDIDNYFLKPTLNSFLTYNYPNPFNPETNIVFVIPEDKHISINIFNLKGEKIKTLFSGYKTTGKHSIVWDGKTSEGKTSSSGVYFYKISGDNYESIRKILLLK